MSDLYKKSVLSLKAKSHDYEVLIGSGVLSELNCLPDAVVVADSRFRESHEFKKNYKCVFVDANEENKTLATVEKIIIQLQQLGVRSKSTVIAVGGGIIQDLMTMVASIYMRGISWIYVPTTLLGMVDSCIGGKSSINSQSVKNLIGNIYPPSKIFIDTDFLDTLSKVDFLCGLAEASKICFCKGESEFRKFLALAEVRTPEGNARMIAHVLSAKKWFIEIDEFDLAERKFLNFGHTFGHALEVGSSHRVPHGLAIASGIKAAIIFESMAREISDLEAELFEFENGLTKNLHIQPDPGKVNWAIYLEAFKADKKHLDSEYVLLLPNFGGGVRLEKLKKSEIVETKIIDAQKYSLSGAKL